MTKDINVYIPLDSLFDYRQGLVTKLITNEQDSLAKRLVDGLNLWEEHFAKAYTERTMDDYDVPALGLTNAKFKEAYEQRDVNDFRFYSPSNLSKALLSVVMALEMEYDRLPDIRAFKLTVNTFPYELDDELSEVLLESLNVRFGGKHEITLMSRDDRKATPSYYRSFTHVFKYDLLLGDYKPFWDNLRKEVIPDVVFFVPSLFLRREEYVTGKPGDVIEAQAITIVNQIAIVPVPAATYDYE